MLADIFDIKRILYIFPIVFKQDEFIICFLLALSLANLFFVAKVYLRIKKEKKRFNIEKENLIAKIKELKIDNPDFWKKLN